MVSVKADKAAVFFLHLQKRRFTKSTCGKTEKLNCGQYKTMLGRSHDGFSVITSKEQPIHGVNWRK